MLRWAFCLLMLWGGIEMKALLISITAFYQYEIWLCFVSSSSLFRVFTSVYRFTTMWSETAGNIPSTSQMKKPRPEGGEASWSHSVWNRHPAAETASFLHFPSSASTPGSQLCGDTASYWFPKWKPPEEKRIWKKLPWILFLKKTYFTKSHWTLHQSTQSRMGALCFWEETVRWDQTESWKPTGGMLLILQMNQHA